MRRPTPASGTRSLAAALVLAAAATGAACSTAPPASGPDAAGAPAPRGGGGTEEPRADSLPLTGGSDGAVNPALGDIDATLWSQVSAEYRAAAIQAYRSARRQLARALEDSSWTAATEQDAPYREKPPAVILDVDETVLDNSPYQARLIRLGETYGPETWAPWVREARAPAVPGALSFARFAHRRGVRVFYVTNRDAELEAPTARNLERLGFPMADTLDVLLTEGERPGWDGSKVARREHVADDHRILLLIGDNLGDFTREPQPGRWIREDAAVRPGGRPARGPRVGDRRWGRRWIVIPNPVYGSWEEAALEGSGELTPAGLLRRKMRTTVPLEPGKGRGGG